MNVTSYILLFVVAVLHFFPGPGYTFAEEAGAVVPALTWRVLPGTLRAVDPCLGTAAQADEEVCNVRGRNYSKAMFPHVSGCYCYLYMNPDFFRSNRTIRMVTCVTSNDLRYPCILLPDLTLLPYDYKNYNTVQALGGDFISSDGINKWTHCSEDAVSCCDNMDSSVVFPGKGYCPANWDGWSCWGKSPAGTTQHEACPDFIYFAEPPSCQQYSDKECYKTGQWNENTDYVPCSRDHMLMLRSRTSYHVNILFVSIATSLPALVIFFSYRKLWVTRVALHRNLILSIVIRNAFSTAVNSLIILDAIGDEREGVMQANSVWCRVLSFMDKLAGSAVYSLMLLEGIFLHRLIAAAFRGEPNMKYYYLVATGFAVLPVGIWTIITAEYNDVNCWAADSTNYGYIIDGPRILTLVINAVLMLDIVRVLWTKLRRVNTVKSGHIRRMTRATILLMPLFGVQFLLTLVRPNMKDCTLEQVYYYIFYTMDGLQGTFVAFFYCYLNKEVHVQVLSSYNLFMARLYRLLGKDYEPKHRPTWAYSERRPTATSMVMPDDVMRPSVTSPSGAGTRKEPHPHNSRPSLVIGNVSDILYQQDGARSPGTRFPLRSTTFPRSSLRNDSSPSSQFVPNRSHLTHSARQRKVSAVSEEAQPEDETFQEQGFVTSRSPTKAHDSDEEVQGSNSGQMYSSQDSPFEDAAVDTFSAPAGLNVGLSGHTPASQAKDRSTASGSETYA